MPIEFIQKTQPLFQPYRYKILYGGRAALKSWTIARVLLLMSVNRPLRILCTREFQNSIKDSVYRLLSDQAELLGIAEKFDFKNTEITNEIGSRFIFTGLRNNITKIKSMEAIDICWAEEAETISAESWEVLIPTIRKPGSEIWISFNPYDEEDATYSRFITNTPPNAFVCKLSWRDNPWLSAEILAEKDYLQRVDPDMYDYVWEGNFLRRSNAHVLLDKVRVDYVKPQKGWQGPYYGVDWGYSSDPTRLVKCWVHQRKLYIEAECDGVQVDLDELPAMFRKFDSTIHAHTVRADNARPEIIAYMRKHGFPSIIGCKKGPGSIQHGITFIRSFEEIVIDPSCKHTIAETKQYKYKVDPRTNKVTSEFVPGYEHSWDAVRYALEPLMPHKGNATVRTTR